ncbi:hypothetical protein NC653_020053 [Populus alba x Populus x berolinensis]|uniref:Uncharacterized protein n=1 Tax=Populus alba x Populus x berolinensis TaxID=444605 RepID=A0AAD6QC04_9ROSI|nr:hypothetical protein NC653_020048 [Populus alba x Populus x berolinensis]KAJ6986706.1 hypothetical protein NC653_020053 [Populus alba x Populus x berolinensis]
MKLQFLLIITSSPFFIDPRMSSPEATTALSVPSFYPGRVSQMVIIYNVQHPRSGFEDNIDGSLSYFWFHTCFLLQFLAQPYKVKSGVNWPPSPSDQ